MLSNVNGLIVDNSIKNEIFLTSTHKISLESDELQLLLYCMYLCCAKDMLLSKEKDISNKLCEKLHKGY